jgi:hypothetical protein
MGAAARKSKKARPIEGQALRTLQDRFIKIANSPAQWRRSAQSLRDGASVILDSIRGAAMESAPTIPITARIATHVGRRSVFLLLAGLAIENLVKGLFVQRGHVTTTSSQLAGELGGHPIRWRLRRMGISLTPREERLLDRLEAAVSWQGKYPVPTKATKLDGVIVTIARDVEEFSRLYDRLDSLLPEKKP